jgi:hypothetical protein
VAQDGARVRLSASAPSFRRAESLEACRAQVQLHLRAVLAENDDEADLRARKAREAKAREYAERVEAVMEAVRRLDNERRDRKPRASTTDPEARVMKMPDETLLADANHASFVDIKDAAARGVEALVSAPKRGKNVKAQAERAPEIAAWLKRAQGPATRAIA